MCIGAGSTFNEAWAGDHMHNLKNSHFHFCLRLIWNETFTILNPFLSVIKKNSLSFPIFTRKIVK